MVGGIKEVAARKRQQIDSSKKTMFIFVASAAFLSGIALVVSIFLLQQIIFHSKVIIEKQSTISKLDKNINTVDELKNNVRVLDTNTALNSVKTSDQSSALQVVLDALPDKANADALGASIKERFIDSVQGLTVAALTTGTANGANADQYEESDSTGNKIPFSLEVSGSADKLKELLAKFEKSIRVIEINSLEIQASDNGLNLLIQGAAYYEPAQSLELQKKVVKP